MKCLNALITMVLFSTWVGLTPVWAEQGTEASGQEIVVFNQADFAEAVATDLTALDRETQPLVDEAVGGEGYDVNPIMIGCRASTKNGCSCNGNGRGAKCECRSNGSGVGKICSCTDADGTSTCTDSAGGSCSCSTSDDVR